MDAFLYNIWKRFVSNKRFAQSKQNLVALTRGTTSCCCFFDFDSEIDNAVSVVSVPPKALRQNYTGGAKTITEANSQRTYPK